MRQWHKRLANDVKGVTVKWDALEGADSYQIYRKTADTGWTLLETTQDANTSYTEPTDYDQMGLGIKYLSCVSPSIFSLENVSGKKLTVYYSGRSSAKHVKIPLLQSKNCSRGRIRVIGMSWIRPQRLLRSRTFSGQRFSSVPYRRRYPCHKRYSGKGG